MGDIDLTEALAAADKAWRTLYFDGAPSRVARDAAVLDAATVVAAQVRAQIAADIEALEGPGCQDDEGLIRIAARIARGDS